MDVNLLKVGDIVVFRRRYYPLGYQVLNGVVTNPQGEPIAEPDYESDYDDHVAMYAGTDQNGQHMLLHSIHNGDPYDTKSGLCRTSFRPLNAQVDDGVAYDTEYVVYRCKDEELAKRAYDLLNLQSANSIPYDSQRLEEMLAQENRFREADRPVSDFLSIARDAYLKEGRYRAVKFAVRPEQWVRTRSDGIGTGLICYTVVILAFQIAELNAKGLINQELKDSSIWNSDKYGVLQEEEEYSEDFLCYHRAITAGITDHSKVNPKFRVSADFWVPNDEYPSIESFTSILPLDAKNCSVSAMTAYFSEQQKGAQEDVHWECLGVVIPPEFSPSPESKVQHRRQQELRRMNSLSSLLGRSIANPDRVSPSGSSTPITSPERAGSRKETSPVMLGAFFLHSPDKVDAASSAGFSTPISRSGIFAVEPVDQIEELARQMMTVAIASNNVPWVVAQMETILATLAAQRSLPAGEDKAESARSFSP